MYVLFDDTWPTARPSLMEFDLVRVVARAYYKVHCTYALEDKRIICSDIKYSGSLAISIAEI